MNRKIVLTGGPSGGKTTLALAIAKAYSGEMNLVPESASLLWAGGFRRTGNPQGIMHQQAAIYRVQVEHEAIYDLEFPGRVLICDRGTLDGLAYWPNSEDHFFTTIGSSRSQELKRYDWVLHLETADFNHYNTQSNPYRVETARQARELNQKVMAVWEGHPQRIVISHTFSFMQKMTLALDVVQRILSGAGHSEITKGLKERP